MKHRVLSISLLLVLMHGAAQAQVFDSLKRTVAFVFGQVHVKSANGQFQLDSTGKPLLLDMPLGTAFFVFYPDERLGKDRGFIYVVTARHVLQDVDGSYLKTVRIRMNLKNADGGSQFDFVELPVADGEGRLLWFQDPENPASDVAVFPFAPDEAKFDQIAISLTIFADKELLKKEKVVEGDALYFIGLMPQYYGDKKNYPLLRKGTLALLTDEDINTETGKQHVYIAEMSAWPGNSGSPVLLNLGGQRETGLFVGYRFYFLGVLLAYFPNLRRGQTVETSTLIGGDLSNIGISLVLPSDTVRKVLDSEPVKQHRERQIPSGKNP